MRAKVAEASLEEAQAEKQMAESALDAEKKNVVISKQEIERQNEVIQRLGKALMTKPWLEMH